MRRVLLTIVALAVAGLLGGAAFVYSGIYDVAATRQHSAPVYWLLQKALTRAIAVRGREVEVPHLSEAGRIRSGLALYRNHCAQCHGAPGIAPAPFALGMTPVPPPIVQTSRELAPGEIFWVVKHGLKMTGMPGWAVKLTDEEIWDIVAFVLVASTLSPVAYYDMAGITPPREASPEPAEAAVARGDPERGKLALQQYGCTSCHTIEGVTGPDAWVGPPLWRIAERRYIAGVLPNSRENLVRWIRNPQGINPLTAMPKLGVTQAHAADIAAYFYALDGIAGAPERNAGAQ